MNALKEDGCELTAERADSFAVIVVRENRSCLNRPEHPKFIYVENYIEAAGMIMAMKAGVHP